MKIIVLGAGALGSIIGAHLVRAGEDVLFTARGHRSCKALDVPGAERAIQRRKGMPLRQKARISLFEGLWRAEE